MDYNTIMESTPKVLSMLYKGYQERRKMEDENLFFGGWYTYVALQTALHNAFRKKSEKAEEYLDKPLLQGGGKKKQGFETGIDEVDSGERELTEDEKRRITENLFMNLQIKMANYELSKIEGKRDG